ncbi:MAG: hypothetical protein Ct9H300mP18_12250 [Candidatus Neomarinimicrobiota bacterium]|nr:MAG: hypothetical protein Ct9H300mP18_12250 [Candidatus Neomarinimicrobiota bacterium]
MKNLHKTSRPIILKGIIIKISVGRLVNNESVSNESSTQNSMI